jgi:hypothetical protein
MIIRTYCLLVIFVAVSILKSQPVFHMKPVILFALSCLSTLAYGQFAFVSDKDGFVNIRKNAEAGAPIMDTLRNGHLVYCMENKGNWSNVDYYKKTKERNGFIYSDRLKFVAEYESLPLITEQPNTVIYGKDSIKVIVSKKQFDKSKYRFTYYKDARDQIQFINGKQYWGADGGVPTTEYKSVIVQAGKKKINLPPSAFDNLFNPTIDATRIYYDKQNDIIYITSMNSDGAGAYDIAWRVVKGIYKDKCIAYGF